MVIFGTVRAEINSEICSRFAGSQLQGKAAFLQQDLLFEILDDVHTVSINVVAPQPEKDHAPGTEGSLEVCGQWNDVVRVHSALCRWLLDMGSEIDSTELHADAKLCKEDNRFQEDIVESADQATVFNKTRDSEASPLAKPQRSTPEKLKRRRPRNMPRKTSSMNKTKKKVLNSNLGTSVTRSKKVRGRPRKSSCYPLVEYLLPSPHPSAAGEGTSIGLLTKRACTEESGNITEAYTDAVDIEDNNISRRRPRKSKPSKYNDNLESDSSRQVMDDTNDDYIGDEDDNSDDLNDADFQPRLREPVPKKQLLSNRRCTAKIREPRKTKDAAKLPENPSHASDGMVTVKRLKAENKMEEEESKTALEYADVQQFTTNDNGVYHCSECAYKSENWCYMKVHIQRSHRAEKQFWCSQCGRQFAGRLWLKKHQMHRCGKDSAVKRARDRETPGTIFACNECEYVARKQRNLEDHIQRRHTEKKHSCPICNKRFSVKKDLNQHIQLHGSVYTCEFCGKTLRSKQGLQLHVDVLHKNKPRPVVKDYLCNACGKVCRNKTDFKIHVNKEHTGLKPFACQHCPKSFYSNAALKAHSEVHAPKLHVCDACGKSFKQRQGLKVHRRSHLQLVERPYQCTTCEKFFTQKGALTRHLRIHTGDRPYSCKLCSASFMDYSVLRRHLLGVHKVDDPKEARRNNIGPQTAEAAAEAEKAVAMNGMSNVYRRKKLKSTASGRPTVSNPMSEYSAVNPAKSTTPPGNAGESISVDHSSQSSEAINLSGLHHTQTLPSASHSQSPPSIDSKHPGSGVASMAVFHDRGSYTYPVPSDLQYMMNPFTGAPPTADSHQGSPTVEQHGVLMRDYLRMLDEAGAPQAMDSHIYPHVGAIQGLSSSAANASELQTSAHSGLHGGAHSTPDHYMTGMQSNQANLHPGRTFSSNNGHNHTPGHTGH